MRPAALSILLATIGLIPAWSGAKTPPPGYVTLRGGGYFPAAGDLRGFDAGPAGELSLSRPLDRGFGLEVSLGAFRAGGRLDPALPPIRRTLRVMPLAFTVRGMAPVGPFEPYALVGLSVCYVHDELTEPVAGWTGAASDDWFTIGYHLGFGGLLLLSDRLFVGLEVRHLFLRASTFDRNTRLDGTTLTAGVGVRF